MSDKFLELKHNYTHQVSAEALFINAGHKALRLECPEIGKEFTDNAYIGKDPEGYLYYSHLTSFNSDRTIHYKSSRIINPYDGKVCSWVQFYSTSIDSCHAEFLAYDPEETVRGCSMDDYTSSGKWKDLVVGSATATISKYDDENTIRITVDPIKKQAIITDSANGLRGQEVDQVKGLLHFKDINVIGNGVYASYNNDRIVFYQNSYNSTDFVAYFVPYESNTKPLGISSSSTVEFSSIQWTTIQ